MMNPEPCPTSNSTPASKISIHFGTVLAVAMLGLACGCGDKPPAAPPPAAEKPAQPGLPMAASTAENLPPPAPPPPGGAAVAPATVPQSSGTNQAFGIDIGEIDLNTISLALQQYVAANQVDPGKLTEQDLQKLVTQRFLPRLPSPPAGKKYVWDGQLQVSLGNK